MFSSGLLLVCRGTYKLMRSPGTVVMGLASSLFFLIVYNAGLGGIGNLDAFGGAGYFSFLFPLSTVSLAMGSAAGAGQSLNADLSSGYFRRLFLSPVPRWSFAVAPIIADAFATAATSAALVGFGVLFGLPLRFGPASFLSVVALSTLWGLALSGFSGGIMLRTGKPDGARMVTTAVFPLIFLSTTFLPRELVDSGWLLAVSRVNPVTYLLEAQRFVLGGTGTVADFVIGLSVSGGLAFVGFVYALTGTKNVLV